MIQTENFHKWLGYEIVFICLLPNICYVPNKVVDTEDMKYILIPKGA